jgi:hypothetical protein
MGVMIKVQAKKMPERRDPLAWILAALCILDFLLIGRRLVVPDLNLDYPFMDGDSWDWIANGLRLTGAGVRASGRPLLLPAVIALLERLSLLPWLPVLLQALFLATVFIFYQLASRLTVRRAAFATTLALLLNHSLRGMSLQIMADVPAACLLFWAVRAFLLVEMDGKPRLYLSSGLWGAASALAQPAALLALLPAGVTLLARRRRDLRSPWLIAGVAAFLLLPALAAAARKLLAAPGDPPVRHAGLLHLSADAVPFYLWSFASLLGLPGVVLLAAGLGLAVRAARRDDPHLFLAFLIGVLLVFFVFFYGFNAERFLVYLLWPAGLLIADVLGRLRTVPCIAAAALLVIGSALPLPGAGNDPSWIGLWPAPPVYAHTGLIGGAAGSPDLSGISVQSFPAADLLRFSIPRRIGAPRPPAPVDRLAPEALTADRGALFLYADPSDGGGRYRTLTRLGNALRRRIKVVPASWLLPSLHRLGISPVGTIGPDYAVFRVRLPGLSGTWLLVATAGGPVRSRLAEASGNAPEPFDPALRIGLAQAEEIRARIAGSDGYVALLPSAVGDPRRFYLPFLLDTTELYIVDPADEREVRGLVAAAPRLGEERIGGATVRRFLYLERRAAAVDLTRTAAPPR